MTLQEIADLRLDITILNSQFNKWYEEDDALSSVLNIKITK
jgi:hypothetical protein